MHLSALKNKKLTTPIKATIINKSFKIGSSTEMNKEKKFKEILFVCIKNPSNYS